jgi:hypothetical protein
VGTWGTGIFADDVADDVRHAYRQLVADGSSGSQATDQLLREWREILDDEDEGPVFWLALAATQWECGRLEERVKGKALEVIDDGSSLGRWSEDGDLRKRQAVLAKLRGKLQSPQPAAKGIRKLPANECPWAVGEVVAYRLPSGKSLLFHLAGKYGSRGEDCLPIFAVLDWVGKQVPSAEVVKALPLKPFPGGTAPYLFAAVRRTKKDFPADRITPLAVRRKPHRQRIDGGYRMLFWKDLDEVLKAEFGVK